MAHLNRGIGDNIFGFCNGLNKILVWVLGVFVVMILAACEGNTTPLITELPGIRLTEAPTALQEQSPTTIQTEVLDPTSEPVPVPSEPAEAPAVAEAPPRAELAATDPSNVQLASGKVQLVEFFAFW